MTEREKRLITLLSKHGPLSKKEVADREQISWATAVKLVARLEKAGIVQCVGTGSQPETTGKDPRLYDLSDRNPLAVGIDVSYSTTNVILTNLKNTILEQQTYQTPKHANQTRLKEFLVSIYSQFVEHTVTSHDVLAGVGIGIPLWLVKEREESFSFLQETLEAQLHTPVRVENNVRSYAMYKKWAGRAFSLDDFILITIRSGVGTGIFCQEQLMRGTHGLAGELSHLIIVEDGVPCRCGKQGCLETLVNQDVLYRDYLNQVCTNPRLLSSAPSETEIHHGLEELFSLAKQRHPEAVEIVQRAARYIGMGIAALLLILDIPHIIIAANFGSDGNVLIPYVEEVVNTRILSGIEYTIAYYPLERFGFARGTALLILEEYFTTMENYKH